MITLVITFVIYTDVLQMLRFYICNYNCKQSIKLVRKDPAEARK